MSIEKKGIGLLVIKPAKPKAAPKAKVHKGAKAKPKKAGAGAAPKTATLSPSEMDFGRLVRTVTQDGRLWCWAACATMVAEFLGISPPSQRNIVQAATGSQTGEEDMGGPGIENVYESGILGAPIDCKYLTHPVSQMRIDQALKEGGKDRKGMVVQLGLTWNTGGGHVVLVTGFSPSSTDDETYYYVNDPDPNMRRRTVSYDGLMSAFSQGNWRETFSAFSV